jgi:hypothetical protein
MVVIRKSPISTAGTWFRRNSTAPGRKRRSRSLGANFRSKSTVTNAGLPLSPKRQRRAAKKLPNTVNQRYQEVVPPSLPPIPQKQETPDAANLPVMPTATAAPIWLLRLYNSHRYSSILTFLLVAATLCVYGWTVYSQQLWSQGYHRLQNLQLHERQLTTTNATLKNKMAEEAEQEASGLVSPTPARTIFLPAASPSATSNATPPSKPANVELQPNMVTPLGY